MAEMITTYTVKQGQGHELKLTLTRDPRATSAKSPPDMKQSSLKPPPILIPSHATPQLPQMSTSGAGGQSLSSGAGQSSSSKKQQVQLPISRVKTIMKTNVKSSQNSLLISQESVVVITKATVSSRSGHFSGHLYILTRLSCNPANPLIISLMGQPILLAHEANSSY